MQGKTVIFLVFAIIISSTYSFGQCCSAGSPVGSSIYLGTLPKNTLRVNAGYRYSLHNDYFKVSDKLEDYGFIEQTYFNFTSLSLGYGITNRITAELDAGYFINKTQVYNILNYKPEGKGLSTGNINFKYGAYMNVVENIEMTIGAGLKFPFSTKKQYFKGAQLAFEIQPSQAAFGNNVQFFASKSWPNHSRKLFTFNKYDYTYKNKYYYQYGWLLTNSLFFSNKIVKNLFIVIEARNELRGKDEYKDIKVNDTGSHVIIISPRIIYSISGKWNLSVLYDIPVYRKYIGTQMGLYQSIAISLTRDFSLNKKANS